MRQCRRAFGPGFSQRKEEKMTKQEAIDYIRSCSEDNGPETVEEAHEIFEAIFGIKPDPDMSHFDAWSHACAAVD